MIVLLVEGRQVAFESRDKKAWPKDFFELMVKKDWRKWVKAATKELEGRDVNTTRCRWLTFPKCPRMQRLSLWGAIYRQARREI